MKLISILIENRIQLFEMKLYFILLIKTNNLYVCLVLRRQTIIFFDLLFGGQRVDGPMSVPCILKSVDDLCLSVVEFKSVADAAGGFADAASSGLSSPGRPAHAGGSRDVERADRASNRVSLGDN